MQAEEREAARRVAAGYGRLPRQRGPARRRRPSPVAVAVALTAGVGVVGVGLVTGLRLTGAPAAVGAPDPVAPLTPAVSHAVPAWARAPVTCPPATTTVTDADGLTAALEAAEPGAVIQLADGVYRGLFTAKADATSRPIYLCGGRGAVLDGGSTQTGYGLHLQGASGWRVVGFTIRDAKKGVMLDGVHGAVLQGLRVEQIGDEAVHLRRSSTHNVVRGLVIRATGLRDRPFGEGLYVGTARKNWCSISGCGPDPSDGNVLVGNDIAGTTAESVDIKEGTTGGYVVGNRFDGTGMTATDSWVDVKGDGWVLARNIGVRTPHDGFQTHVVVPGWGDRNLFTANRMTIGGGGVGIRISRRLTNRVKCDNEAAGELSNVSCR